MHGYHSDMRVCDWSTITTDHAIGSDWSTGGVHVMGDFLLVNWEVARVFGA